MKFDNAYEEFIYLSRYSRWDWDKCRREKWEETIGRYLDYMTTKVPDKYKDKYKESVGFYLSNRLVMPSMRALWTAGPALERENIAAYNCAGTTVDSIKSFAEVMYILLCGGGVGFSVERQYIAELPMISAEIVEISGDARAIKFTDSKLGWAEGFLYYLESMWLRGQKYPYDLSDIRAEGEILKTFGGRASGPEPLKLLLDFSANLLYNARGRKLNSIECHDLLCYIGNVVVSGGVRRSAMLSLSNLTDARMRRAKEGAFWNTHPYRSLANNSVAYTEKPDIDIFMEEWLSLAKSGSGERGVFNREACEKLLPERREKGYNWICNPCSEIVMRPKQFCNLTEVVVRSKDTLSELCEKVKAATILGCVQSTLTNFNFLSDEWRKNCEDERLLGVSLTGVCDHPVLSGSKGDDRMGDWLGTMKETSVKVAKRWAKYLDINVPSAITCVKPSGTVSQLVNASSGIHPRHSHYYTRRVRHTTLDPLSKFLIDSGVPNTPEGSSTIFSFPIKSPRYSIFRNDRRAIEQLEMWEVYQREWCEHKPSCTIYVKEDEWLEVGAWIYKHWDIVSGISFLPYDGGIYANPPYEEITKEEYERAVRAFPRLSYEGLGLYETSDYTEGAKEYACTGGGCEL